MFSWRDLLRPKEYGGQTVIYAQRKMDGMRVLVRRLQDGWDAYTREGKTDLWPNLSQAIALPPIPPCTALDCELYAEGVQATDIKTLLINRDSRLRLAVFAVPWWSGQDNRGESLPTAMGRVRTSSQIITPVATVLPNNWSADVLKQAAAEFKWEGWVLKWAHYAGWYKLKPVRTADFVVLSTTRSTSVTKFGWLKAVQVGIDGVEYASVGTGFDDEFRRTVNQQSLVGRVCEVSYDSMAGKGKLKFPRFVRWRDDKTPAECTKDQLL